MGQFSKISSSNTPGFQHDFTFTHKYVLNREWFFEIPSNKAPGTIFTCTLEWISSAFIIPTGVDVDHTKHSMIYCYNYNCRVADAVDGGGDVAAANDDADAAAE